MNANLENKMNDIRVVSIKKSFISDKERKNYISFIVYTFPDVFKSVSKLGMYVFNTEKYHDNIVHSLGTLVTLNRFIKYFDSVILTNDFQMAFLDWVIKQLELKERTFRIKSGYLLAHLSSNDYNLKLIRFRFLCGQISPKTARKIYIGSGNNIKVKNLLIGINTFDVEIYNEPECKNIRTLDKSVGKRFLRIIK